MERFRYTIDTTINHKDHNNLRLIKAPIYTFRQQGCLEVRNFGTVQPYDQVLRTEVSGRESILTIGEGDTMFTQRLMKGVLGAGLGLFSGLAMAHPGHIDAQDARVQALVLSIQEAGEKIDYSKTTGQGALKFKVLRTSQDLPKDVKDEHLKAAHGGFAVDRREGHGEIYFSLPNFGILRISADLKSIEAIPTNHPVKSNNMHNTTIWYDKDDQAYLTFPGNGSASVYTTDLQGNLLNVLSTPTADVKFGKKKVTKYFAGGGNFVPTDVEYVNDQFYVATGYSALDFVLQADVKLKKNDFGTAWNGDAFGGKGDGVGQFGTGHGITLAPDGNSITVADRPRSEIDRFTFKGDYLSTLSLPKGCLPCDVDYVNDLTVVGCLKGPDKDKGAPIYIVKDEVVISTIMIKEDLGLSKFTHIHNAVMIDYKGTYYVIAQAWNPGDFAILEQVK